MWLVDTETYERKEFIGALSGPERQVPQYAILSHTWGDDEVSFRDMQDLDVARRKAGFWKIERACDEARKLKKGRSGHFKDPLRYEWADTCCIEKSSSTELQEAINSVFNYCSQAAECYILPDVTMDTERGTAPSRFTEARWFTRGWTLQELIAPGRAFFFDRNWKPIGSRSHLSAQIADMTRIDVVLLKELGYIGKDALSYTRSALRSFSIAQRMS